MKWNESDSARFREYDSKSNGKLRLFLRTFVPLTKGKTIEEVALEAKYKEGVEFILRKLDEIILDEKDDNDASSASFQQM
jgi:hypothetical protein